MQYLWFFLLIFSALYGAGCLMEYLYASVVKLFNKKKGSLNAGKHGEYDQTAGNS